MNARTTKLLLVIIILFMTFTIATVVVHLFNNDYITETAVAATASNSVSFKGVYVRDEEVLYDNGPVISYEVNDGGRVSKNEVAANIYSDEEQIRLKEEIQAVEKEIAILEKIQNPGTKEVAQPSYLASLIEEKYKEIALCKETGDLEQLKAVKEELLIYLSTMQYVVTKETNDESSEIQAEIDSLRTKLNELNLKKKDPIRQIIVSHSAYFASYVDGYENILTYDKIDTLTAAQIRSVTDYHEKEYTDKPVGKLINGYQWKIIGVIDDQSNLFAKERGIFNLGKDVSLYFPDDDKSVNATIESIRDGDRENEKILTLSCSEMSYGFVQHRVETVEIQDKIVKGIRVSRDAICFKKMKVEKTDPKTKETVFEEKEVKGVYVKVGENVQFKRVEEIFIGTDYIISEVKADDDYVQLYDDTIIKGAVLK